jgi:hypothetical protein
MGAFFVLAFIVLFWAWASPERAGKWAAHAAKSFRKEIMNG